MPIIAGIDGCKAGWLCLIRDIHTGAVSHMVLANISDLLTLTPRPDVVAIDIPIGLPATGSRACDIAARAELGRPRASSVFPAPIRPTLTAKDYADACCIGKKEDGRSLTKQTWAIMPKITEVDDFIRASAGMQEWIREVHPELSFCYMNKKKAMGYSKRTPEGRSERQTLIEQQFGALIFNGIPLRVPGNYAPDDLFDAFAALWTAERILQKKATSHPATPENDNTGLRMEIIA